MDTLVLRQAVEWWIGEVLDTEKPSVLSYKHKSAPPPFRNSLLLWEHLPRKTPLVCKPGRLASAYCTARQYARDSVNNKKPSYCSLCKHFENAHLQYVVPRALLNLGE